MLVVSQLGNTAMFDLKNKLSRMFRNIVIPPQTLQLEKLIAGAEAGNAAEVTSAINHPRVEVYRLIEDGAMAILDSKNETAWKTLVECTAEAVKSSDESVKTYFFSQLFFGNAGYRGTPAMVDTVLTTAEKAGLGVNFNLDQQLAFFVGASDTDEKSSAISEILMKHGADLGKVSGIFEEWTKGTNVNWDKAIAEAREKEPENVEEFKRRKEAGLTGLQKGTEAAQRFIAAHKPPTPG